MICLTHLAVASDIRAIFSCYCWSGFLLTADLSSPDHKLMIHTTLILLEYFYFLNNQWVIKCSLENKKQSFFF